METKIKTKSLTNGTGTWIDILKKGDQYILTSDDDYLEMGGIEDIAYFVDQDFGYPLKNESGFEIENETDLIDYINY